jgi:hypothetical protein
MKSSLLNISRGMTKSRLSLRPTSSALSKGLATTVSGGEVFRLKVLLMEWIYLPRLKTVPELCGRR